MKKVSPALIQGFRNLSARVNVGIVAIADKSGMPIIFTSKILHTLGYNDEELIGKTFPRILPMSVRVRHQGMMFEFRNEEESGNSRPMSKGRTVKALHKNESEVDVSISISYHASSDPDEPGIFIAMIQDPLRKQVSDRTLDDLKIQFSDIVYRGQEFQKKARRIIRRKIAAGGGIFTVLAAILTQITPVGTALKGAWSAWNWGWQKPNVGTIGVYEKVGTKERDRNLVLMRNEIQRQYPEVIAVAYLRVDEEDGNITLKFQSDSNSQAYGEVWFFDTDPASVIPIMFSPEQLKKLRSLDCIVYEKGARLINAEGRPFVEVIFCPTMRHEPLSTNQSLTRLRFSNLTAIALRPGVSIPEGSERFVTITGKLFELQPNVENLGTR